MSPTKDAQSIQWGQVSCPEKESHLPGGRRGLGSRVSRPILNQSAAGFWAKQSKPFKDSVSALLCWLKHFWLLHDSAYTLPWIWLPCQTIVSRTSYQGPQDHSPEEQRYETWPRRWFLRKWKGSHPQDCARMPGPPTVLRRLIKVILRPLSVWFPERTKGRTAAGPGSSAIPAHWLQEGQMAWGCPPTRMKIQETISFIHVAP